MTSRTWDFISSCSKVSIDTPIKLDTGPPVATQVEDNVTCHVIKIYIFISPTSMCFL